MPASVAASPINHERQRGDCAREQIYASPRRSEPKHASRSDRATVMIFVQSDHIASEIRAVMSTSRRPAFKTGNLLAPHAHQCEARRGGKEWVRRVISGW